MTVRDDIYQRVRAWLMKSAQLNLVELADNQVIRAEQAVPYGNVRPPLPYITVKVRVADQLVGTDEGVITDPGGTNYDHHVRGLRRGLIELNGFGAEASDWMALAHLRLTDPVMLAEVLNDESGSGGITLVPEGPERDISTTMGTQFEARYNREYTVSYQLSSVAGKQTAPAASTIEVDMTFESDSPPGDFSETITAP